MYLFLSHGYIYLILRKSYVNISYGLLHFTTFSQVLEDEIETLGKGWDRKNLVLIQHIERDFPKTPKQVFREQIKDRSLICSLSLNLEIPNHHFFKYLF